MDFFRNLFNQTKQKALSQPLFQVPGFGFTPKIPSPTIGEVVTPIKKHFEEKAPIGALFTGKPQEFIPRLKTTTKKYERQAKEEPLEFAMGFTPLGMGKIAPKILESKPIIDPVQKVITALKEAKPIRKTQEALYTKARGIKLAKSLEAGKKVTGEKGFYEELGQLKGELPKVQYESLRGKIGQEDIDNLFIKVKDSPLLNEWDKITAREGLAKVFGQMGGTVPTEGELKLLNKTFGPDFVKAVSDKRSLLTKFAKAGLEISNIPRSLMASFDLSAPLRQGLFLLGRPKQFFPAFAKQFKYFGSEKAFRAGQEEIVRRPTFELMNESRLALTDMDNVLTAREERFMSSWAEKIPLAGKVVRMSGRAYTGFLNKLRADVFDDLLQKAEMQGLDPKNNPDLTKSLANFINTATGRGGLGPLERAATAFNSFFFSPRLMASRLKLLYPGFYMGLDPFVRKEALKSLLTFSSMGLTVLGLAKMAGAEVNIDPRNADFGKIKVGNTRLDPWGGFQQYIRLAAQLISGKIVSSTTGQIMTLGEGYRPLTRLDILERFIEYKEAPLFSFATALLKGQTAIGEKIDLPTEIANRFIPMVVGDMYDLYKEKGLEGMFVAPLAIFGIGIQTYGPKEDTPYGMYQKLETLAPKEKAIEIIKLKKTDPVLFGKVKKLIIQKRIGITPEEEALANYSVEERGQRIIDQLNKLEPEQKAIYVKKLKVGGILTDNVMKQIKILKIKELQQKQQEKETLGQSPLHNFPLFQNFFQ